jgi:hypothetical protein
MSKPKNLWPEEILNENSLLLPIMILNQQAAYLNEMTKNIVVAQVDTQKVSIQKKPNESKPAILHTLKIKAPAIGNYDFELVRVIQEGFLPYPAIVYTPILEYRDEVDNAEELEDSLETIFADKKVISTIQSLIMQSRQ